MEYAESMTPPLNPSQSSGLGSFDNLIAVNDDLLVDLDELLVRLDDLLALVRELLVAVHVFLELGHGDGSVVGALVCTRLEYVDAGVLCLRLTSAAGAVLEAVLGPVT